MYLPLLGVESCWLKLLNFDSALVVGEEDLEVFLSHPDAGRQGLSWTVNDGRFCADILSKIKKQECLLFRYFSNKKLLLIPIWYAVQVITYYFPKLKIAVASY